MSFFEVEIIVRGPARTVETNYGPRTERAVLAQCEIPTKDELAFSVFREAYDSLTTAPGDFLVEGKAL